MKQAKEIKLRMPRLIPTAGVALAALPGVVWSHPGHGLDGVWVHDVLHGLTVVCAIALVSLLTVGFMRRRRSNKHR